MAKLRIFAAAGLFVSGILLVGVWHSKSSSPDLLLRTTDSLYDDAGVGTFDVPSARHDRMRTRSTEPEKYSRSVWDGRSRGGDEEVRITDPPGGWLQVPTAVGSRAIHIQRNADSSLNRIDLPKDAVVRRVADGWEIEVPTEKSRDGGDDNKLLPKGFRLERRHLSSRKWAEKRLLERFLQIENQADTDGEDSDNDDEGRPNEAVMNVHVTRAVVPAQQETPVHQDRTECEDLECLLGQLSKEASTHRVVHVTVGDAGGMHEDKKQSCGIACLIHKIIRGEESRAKTTSTEEPKNQGIDIPANAKWERTSKGWHISIPPAGSDDEESDADEDMTRRAAKLGLKMPVKPRPSAHAIVDVYAPYEDPYYCADGSSSAECGTGKQHKVRVHDYTLGWTPDDGSAMPPVPASGQKTAATREDDRDGSQGSSSSEGSASSLVAVVKDLLHVILRGNIAGKQQQNSPRDSDHGASNEYADADSVRAKREDAGARNKESSRLLEGGAGENESARLKRQNRELAALLGKEVDKVKRLEAEERLRRTSVREQSQDMGDAMDNPQVSSTRDSVRHGMSDSKVQGTQQVLAQWIHDAQLNDDARKRAMETVHMHEQGASRPNEDTEQVMNDRSDQIIDNSAQKQQLVMIHQGNTGTSDDQGSSVLQGVGKWLGAYENHKPAHGSKHMNKKSSDLSATTHTAARTDNAELGAGQPQSVVGEERKNTAELGAQEWEDQYQHVHQPPPRARLMQLAQGSELMGGMGERQTLMQKKLQLEDKIVNSRMSTLSNNLRTATARVVSSKLRGMSGVGDARKVSLMQEARVAADALLQKTAEEGRGGVKAARREIVHESELLRMKMHSEQSRKEDEEERAQGGGSFGWLWGK